MSVLPSSECPDWMSGGSWLLSVLIGCQDAGLLSVLTGCQDAGRHFACQVLGPLCVTAVELVGWYHPSVEQNI